MTDSSTILGLDLFRSGEVQKGILGPTKQESGNFPQMFSLSHDKTKVKQFWLN